MFDHQLVLLLDRDNPLINVWRNGQPEPDKRIGPYLQDMLNSPLVQVLVAVNISPVQFRAANVVERIIEIV